MEPDVDGSVGLSGGVGGNNSGMPQKNPNSHISFGGFGAALNPPAMNYNLATQPRPQAPADPYMQQYLMANNHSAAYPAMLPMNLQQQYPQQQHAFFTSSSLQPAVFEDERAYAKYDTSNMINTNTGGGGGGGGGNGTGNGNGNGNSHLLRTQSSGPARPTAAPTGNAAPSNRRPQSALDRPTHSSSTNSSNNKNNSNNMKINTTAGGPTVAGHVGISPGMYTAELKALMGSAAYNRPVSAPQNHHVNVENISSYQEATQRMREKEERAKTTMEQLESVYKAPPYGGGSTLPRTGSSGALPAVNPVTLGEPKFLNPSSSSGNMGTSGFNADDGGRRPGSANRWGTATAPATSTAAASGPARSAVDRALNIGKGTAAYLPSSNLYTGGVGGGASNTNNNAPPPRERARSAARGTRDRSSGGGGGGGIAQDVGRTLPLDIYTKQARLSEMFDEGILDKLDSAIGLPRR